MKVVVQRVKKAAVRLSSGESRSIGAGLVVLLGIGREDGEVQAQRLAKKISEMRIFPNEQGKFDLSLMDVQGEALVVSQFTLYGNVWEGRRPDFTRAAPPETAQGLYLKFADCLRRTGVPVKTGEFGDLMQVELVNDGPVTIIISDEQ